jgi:hypothetical protein
MVEDGVPDYGPAMACAQALRDCAMRLREGQVLARRMEQFVTLTRADGSEWTGIVAVELPEGVVSEVTYG